MDGLQRNCIDQDQTLRRVGSVSGLTPSNNSRRCREPAHRPSSATRGIGKFRSHTPGYVVSVRSNAMRSQWARSAAALYVLCKKSMTRSSGEDAWRTASYGRMNCPRSWS